MIKDFFRRDDYYISIKKTSYEETSKRKEINFIGAFKNYDNYPHGFYLFFFW